MDSKREILREDINKSAPMNRIQGDWWYDELTDVQSYLMDALEMLNKAMRVGSNSTGSFVTELTDRIPTTVDDICLMLGISVRKRVLITQLRKD